jgi:Fe-S cluster assembly protein SufB
VPDIEAKDSSAVFEHETSKISQDMLFHCMQRGLTQEEPPALVVNGFVRDVLQQLPMEFAVEAQKLISISLEGSVDGRHTIWSRPAWEGRGMPRHCHVQHARRS